MITNNVIYRTIRIRTEGGMGSAFLLHRADSEAFIVTAAHVLPAGDPTPKVWTRGAWHEAEMTLKLIPIEPEGIDVAVAWVGRQASELIKFTLGYEPQGFAIGQDVWLLGFPLGYDASGIEPDLRYPLVKKACVSGLETGGPLKQVYLDGHNNPGFSGGPVVGVPLARPGAREAEVLGVINGYLFDEHGGNSGIILATGIGHVRDAINAFEVPGG